MRLFVAVPVPGELRQGIAGLGKEIAQDGVSGVRAENMHLTLKFIGETEPGKLEDIKEKLRKIEFGRFGCDLRGVGAFPSENYIRVVWTGAESGGALEELAGKVMASLHGYGQPERFTAHLTIARVKRKLDLGAFLEKHRNEDFGSFEVTRFELIESVLGGPKGPEYRTVGVFQSD